MSTFPTLCVYLIVLILNRSTVFQIPIDILPGSHRLLVEGLANTAGEDILFTNETELNFEAKYISVFIRTDHFEYYPETTGMRIFLHSSQFLPTVFLSISSGFKLFVSLQRKEFELMIWLY